MMRALPALALALFAACTPVSEPDTRRNALFHAMQGCLAEPEPAGSCVLVDRAQGFVVLKDRDPAKPEAWLLVPDVEVTGIEDSRVLEPPVVDFWRHGWDVARRLIARPPDRTALAINSRAGRSQDLLHIHISCLDRSVAKALASATVGRGWATRLTLDGHAYHARRVTALEPSPFLLLREIPGAAADMASQSLAVTGAPGGGFLLLADATGPNGPGEAEELLDETCR